MNISRTNVRRDDTVLEAVIDCWASLFTPRVVTYRARRGMRVRPVMAVVVQRMVNAQRSGVLSDAETDTPVLSEERATAVAGPRSDGTETP